MRDLKNGRVSELVDDTGLKPVGRKTVRVRIPPRPQLRICQGSRLAASRLGGQIEREIQRKNQFLVLFS